MNAFPQSLAPAAALSPKSLRSQALLRAEAERLSGGLGDYAARAMVYHAIYRASGGNHAFPLLAAHGALWAAGYFRRGLAGASLLNRLDGAGRAERARRAEAVTAFADAFREINRRVCVETLYIHSVTRGPQTAALAALLPDDLTDRMATSHSAARDGRRLARPDRRLIFESFFLWEQRSIVGPAVDAAFAAFDWPMVARQARRPRIGFSYLTRAWPIRFADFGETAERVEAGLRAFDAAESIGWDQVEAALMDYGLLPQGYLADPDAAFETLRRTARTPQPASASRAT